MNNRPDIICIFMCCCHIHFASSFPFPLFFVKFGELGGFTAIQAKLNTEEIEIAVSTTTFTFKWSGVSLEWWNSYCPDIDGERCCRQPIQAKGHHVYPHDSQLQGVECFSLSLSRLHTNTLSHPPAVWWLKCSVVSCVLRHPCTDASFWEPGRKPLQCIAIDSHTCRHTPSTN